MYYFVWLHFGPNLKKRTKSDRNSGYSLQNQQIALGDYSSEKAGVGVLGRIPDPTKNRRSLHISRFAIALHSPVKVTEIGLRMCRPEKGQQIDAIRSRAVRSLQSALRPKYCGIRACFAYFATKRGAVSLQFRLAGGANGIRTLGTVSAMLISTRVSTTYCD